MPKGLWLKKGFFSWQYNMIGVSDAITMSHEGPRFSLKLHSRPSIMIVGGIIVKDYLNILRKQRFMPAQVSEPVVGWASPIGMGKCNRAVDAITFCLEKDITLEGFSLADLLRPLLFLRLESECRLAFTGNGYNCEYAAEFQRVSNKIPFITDLTLGNRDFNNRFYELGLLDGGILTITGKTLVENVQGWPFLPPNQPTAHLQILRGNIASKGAVAKTSGKEGLLFHSKTMCFAKERHLNLAGGELPNIALITDGKYSGVSHQFLVGHVCPETAVGGHIALVQDGDMITIDAVHNTINFDVSDEELPERKASWKPPKPSVSRGTLAKYAAVVGDASHGAILILNDT
ncbi:dehydratase family domain-containing protein [Trichoderma velutinum]